MHRWALSSVLVGTLLVTGCATRQAVPRPFPGAPAPPVADPTPTTSAPAAAVPPPSTTADKTIPPVAAVAPVEAPTVTSAPWVSPLLTTALGLRGTPYRFGGNNPTGFDCSGFVRYVFAQFGYQLPREVQAQFKTGRPIDRDEIQPGDLVFFETVSKGASHVGIALGNDEFVHAPSSRGVVRTERYTIEYWARRWIGARRVG
jgi:cell wall-associated NlpC family hydrolase